MTLQPTLIKNIISMYAETGRQWLNQLPLLLADYEKKWQLTLGNFFPNLSFNYVVEARLPNGTAVVLKCGVPNKELMQEAAALKHFNGCGAVKLLQSDAEQGVLLLEKVMPGIMLEDDQQLEKATNYAVEVMRKLHKPIHDTSPFPTLQDWFKGFDHLYTQFNGTTGPFPTALIERAQNISHDLLTSMTKQVLLHGDLHYANILFSDTQGWLAIDPKGVIGEPEYDIPLPRLNAKRMSAQKLKYELDRFIELSGFDNTRIMHWFFCKMVLAAWWSFEDSGEIYQPFLDYAQMFLDCNTLS